MKQGYRRKSVRLRGYDYSQGSYFVTISAAHRKCLFGKVVNGEMELSLEGQIVKEEWEETARNRRFIKLDKFVVMPNHFHAILSLGIEEGTARRAPTKERFGRPAVESLPTIVRSFKSAVTNRINLLLATSGSSVWQRSFYEHVIRNESSLNRIREYILNNPLLWELDRENPGRRGEHEFYRWLESFKTRPK